MKDNKEQISLFKKTKLKRNKYEPKEDRDRHKSFVVTFIKKHQLLIGGTFVLFITQGISETLLVFISKLRLSFDARGGLSQSFWPIFIALIVIFIVNSFFSIKQEKTIVVLFVNSLRRRIFKNYLGKPLSLMDSEKQANLISKISYHLPLVSMGVSNSIFGLVRWLIYLASAILVTYLAGLNIIFVALGLIFISVTVAVGSYFVVKQYVSQEVTFYSQIIKHIDLSLSEKYFSKSFNLEPAILKKFDTLVNFDSIFRIRRDLWMKMSFKVIFVLILFISVLTHLFYNDITLQINLISPDLKFLYLFLLFYLSRIIFESLKIGLYLFPTKLGLSLTNVRTEKYNHRENFIKLKEEIIFYSRKIRLFKGGKYYKNLKFTFKKSGRYLLYGPNFCGKTTLAEIMLGYKIFNSKALKIKIDGLRISFSEYQSKFSDAYLFNPSFRSQKSILEVVAGSDREDTNFAKVEQALKIMADYQSLSHFISKDNNFSVSSDGLWNNSISSFALHCLHCLVNKPTLIIIDNFWMDLSYQDISSMLQIISRELPDSIIIVFAKDKLTNLNYDKCYDFDKNFN